MVVVFGCGGSGGVRFCWYCCCCVLLLTVGHTTVLFVVPLVGVRQLPTATPAAVVSFVSRAIYHHCWRCCCCVFTKYMWHSHSCSVAVFVGAAVSPEGNLPLTRTNYYLAVPDVSFAVPHIARGILGCVRTDVGQSDQCRVQWN